VHLQVNHCQGMRCVAAAAAVVLLHHHRDSATMAELGPISSELHPRIHMDTVQPKVVTPTVCHLGWLFTRMQSSDHPVKMMGIAASRSPVAH